MFVIELTSKKKHFFLIWKLFVILRFFCRRASTKWGEKIRQKCCYGTFMLFIDGKEELWVFRLISFESITVSDEKFWKTISNKHFKCRVRFLSRVISDDRDVSMKSWHWKLLFFSFLEVIDWIEWDITMSWDLHCSKHQCAHISKIINWIRKFIHIKEYRRHCSNKLPPINNVSERVLNASRRFTR